MSKPVEIVKYHEGGNDPLPDNATIRFNLEDGYIEVKAEDGAVEVRGRCKRGFDKLSIEPVAGNAVTVKLVTQP